MHTQAIRYSNRTILDMKKIAYVAFFYRSGSYEKFLKPKLETVHGAEIDPTEYAHYDMEYPLETLIERARRLSIVDDPWVPILKVVMCNGHVLEYTGNKAISLKDTFSSKQFK